MNKEYFLERQKTRKINKLEKIQVYGLLGVVFYIALTTMSDHEKIKEYSEQHPTVPIIIHGLGIISAIGLIAPIFMIKKLNK